MNNNIFPHHGIFGFWSFGGMFGSKICYIWHLSANISWQQASSGTLWMKFCCMFFYIVLFFSVGMAGLRFYYDLMSQPSRAVFLFLKATDIPFIAHKVAMRKGVYSCIRSLQHFMTCCLCGRFKTLDGATLVPCKMG